MEDRWPDGTPRQSADGSATHCELCEAARFTHWYHEDEHCWIADCEACGVPMVVWRDHGVDPPSDVLGHMLGKLRAVATANYGPVGFQIDQVMRQIPDHFHAHARDIRRWLRPGVDTPPDPMMPPR